MSYKIDMAKNILRQIKDGKKEYEEFELINLDKNNFYLFLEDLQKLNNLISGMGGIKKFAGRDELVPYRHDNKLSITPEGEEFLIDSNPSLLLKKNYFI